MTDGQGDQIFPKFLPCPLCGGNVVASWDVAVTYEPWEFLAGSPYRHQPGVSVRCGLCDLYLWRPTDRVMTKEAHLDAMRALAAEWNRRAGA